ncbi:MAG: hypothetical protein AB7F28_05915 [Candidatus Margulisiibacteriota bacterium]
MFPERLDKYVMPLLQKLEMHLDQSGYLQLIYILTLDHQMICADYEVEVENKRVKLHHTQLSAFDENEQAYTPVFCAGEMKWQIQGGCATLVSVNNQSGRFRPPSTAIKFVYAYLETLRENPRICLPDSLESCTSYVMKSPS